MNKIVPSVEQAVADIPDGATVMIGSFGAAGLPLNLIRALIAKGTKNLTGSSIPISLSLLESSSIVWWRPKG